MQLTPQEALEAEILDGKVDTLDVDVSDTYNTVIITTNGIEALYTADEARAFADRMEKLSREVWETDDNEDVIEFIRDVAGIVDGNKQPSAIEKKWS